MAAEDTEPHSLTRSTNPFSDPNSSRNHFPSLDDAFADELEEDDEVIIGDMNEYLAAKMFRDQHSAAAESEGEDEGSGHSVKLDLSIDTLAQIQVSSTSHDSQ